MATLVEVEPEVGVTVTDRVDACEAQMRFMAARAREVAAMLRRLARHGQGDATALAVCESLVDSITDDVHDLEAQIQQALRTR